MPLCFEKSLWTTVAMLGILKAGGAFILLDPLQPEIRLRSIVQQSQGPLVLSSSAKSVLSSKLVNKVLVVCESLISDLHTSPDQPLPRTNPSAVLYAVFTSGSIGTPKGVVLTYTSFCSALHHQLDYFGFNSESRVFDFASYAFDVAVHNMLATLTSGACLCVPLDEDRSNNLEGCITEIGATHINLTLSMVRLLDPQSLLP
jgi:non-ribosomal peptide synthetase component F